MAENYLEKFKKLLSELFMFDQADLDFGIYRIMNAKRDEITRFLDQDLLPQVRAAISELEQSDRAVLQTDLTKAIEQAKGVGIDPETAPRVKELRRALAQTADVEALETEVFSDLYNFFRRYYDDGDFLSLRRYKEGVYAIPYEGEEVKLYWANYDQYYIKTAEYFRDYTFTVGNGRRAHFRLAEADTEQNSNQPANGQERRFILRELDPVSEENGELVIRFEYRPDVEKRKQTDLNVEAARRILDAERAHNWLADIAAKAPTEKNPDRTVLDKRLVDYTTRNTFDYFIHKDLGGFLRRELDFYIKNEIVHLDDIESEAAPRVEQYLAKVKAIRRIAHKIIDFLAQIENFEKKLWLKKKFVVETNYCITLDQIPEEFYSEIAANDAQRDEWVELFAINSIDGVQDGLPLSLDFLKQNRSLVLDTRHFPAPFASRLLAGMSDIEERLDGTLIHSENFQALNLIQPRYSGCIECIYADPPYNTSENTFVYKNFYKHSSWIAMIHDRLSVARRLLSDGGVLQCAIDDTETAPLRQVMDVIFGRDNRVATLAIEVNPAGQNLRPNTPALSHDYCHIYAYDISKMEMLLRDLTEEEQALYKGKDSKGPFLWDNLRRRGGNSRPSDRPGQWFPLYVDRVSKRVSVDRFDGAEEIWPIDPKGERRIWRTNPDGARREITAGEISVIEKAGRLEIVKKTRMPQGKKPKTLWDDTKYSATTYGTKLLNDIIGEQKFSYPKSLYLVVDCLRYWCDDESLVLDFFGGSGTTGHAVITLNRDDAGKRKYILAEMGEHFDTVLLPRIKKVIYSKDWKNGKPVSRDGVTQMFKYVRLESYEDTLANLELKRSSEQGDLLGRAAVFREDYLLRYLLDVESDGSASLLDTERFENPFHYTLNVGDGSAGETKPVVVDLIETFNWLLGLRLKHIDAIRGFRVVQGTSPKGEKALVIWRNTHEKTNADLDDFFLKQGYNTRDMEFDLVYVNGDNNLENLKRPDETWKVRLIEEEFKRLMFDVEDV